MKKLYIVIIFTLSCVNLLLAQVVNFVTNTNDSGPGSFRQAIINANANGKSIQFNIPVSDNNPLIIKLTSPLPDVTANVSMGFVNVYSVAGPPAPVYLNTMIIDGQNGVVGPGIRYLNINARPGSIAAGTFINFTTATLTVTNTDDDGVGSLRDAIFHANLCTTKDNIIFNIPGAAPHKMTLSTYLPTLSAMSIDGSTQPANGYTGNAPKIEFDGSTGYNGICFTGSANTDFYGMYIHNFTTAIQIGGSNHIIGAPGKGNVLSGNNDCAIIFGGGYYFNGNASLSSYASNTTIQNNLIGTTPDGKSAEPNEGFMGAINVGGQNNKILNNVISGNNTAIGNYGTTLSSSVNGKTISNLEIKGNKIGTDVDGIYALPNEGIIDFNLFANDVVIGGPSLADRNIISGNMPSFGLLIFDLGGTQNFTIENNFIGTDVTGVSAIPNTNFSIVAASTNNKGLIKNNIIAYNSVGATNWELLGGEKCVIIHNSIYNNSRTIRTNATLAAPVITLRSTDSIMGTSSPNVKVELFEDNGFNLYPQGKDFIGETTADASGNWKYKGTILNPCKITSIAIDLVNNSSSTFSEGSNYSLGADKTACINDTIIFDAKPGYSSYLWSTGATTRTIKVTQPGDYFVEVDNGCLFKDTIKAIFMTRPVVTLGNDTTVCYNQPLVLNAGNPGATYRWNSANGSQTRNVTTTITTTTIAEVSFGDCKNTDTIKVTVIPNLFVNLGADKSVCTGTPVILTDGNTGASSLWSDGKTTKSDTITTPGKYWLRSYNSCFTVADTIVINHVTVNVNLGSDTLLCTPNSLTLNAGNPGATYKWNNVTGTQTKTVTTANTYFVDVTVNGCTKRDSIIVTAAPAPIVNLGANISLCQGQSTVLNAGNNGATYKWNNNNSLTAQTLTASASGDYFVDVTSNGCTKRDSIIVTVNSLPTVDLGTDITICQGQSTILNAGNNGATYKWNNNNSLTTQTLTASTAGDYFVDVTNNGCTKRDSIVVTVNSLPTVNLGPDITICQGQSAILNAGNSGGTFIWNGNPTLVTGTLTADTAGKYIVQVTVNGCSQRDTVMVTVNQLPSINLGNDIILDPGQSITLDAGNIGAQFSWSTGATSQSIVVNVASTIRITVTVAGCENSDTITISMSATTDLLNGEAKGNKLKIYPNPSAGKFMVELPDDLTLSEDATLQIVNSAGMIIEERNAVTTNEILLNSGKGTYFIKLMLKEKQFTQKLVVE